MVQHSTQIGGMRRAELGEGMWERTLAREEKGLGMAVGTEH